jgi:hypothetical protein
VPVLGLQELAREPLCVLSSEVSDIFNKWVSDGRFFPAPAAFCCERDIRDDTGDAHGLALRSKTISQTILWPLSPSSGYEMPPSGPAAL